MKRIIFSGIFLLTFFSAVTISSCSSIAHFDQVAYSQMTAVESDALSMMDKATEDYAIHKQEVDVISNRIQQAYLYDKNRPKNRITEEMWKLIMDPDGHLYGGFIARWKSEGKLKPVFIAEAKKKVQENFDRIAQLESKKIKS
ncbi:hypothetical protein QWZ08_10380 [Ferruginibacter paludis]|uniref:hypothetical protein n=1 Tax=Ferruginibacter paludis TaxID=1310417 RepID=UPI0025B5EA9F|nr:hypothetical protein [Ferruginibacter paludis]MDN3656034.1 hypothetical protein [Ferruginibacter paludis]